MKRKDIFWAVVLVIAAVIVRVLLDAGVINFDWPWLKGDTSLHGYSQLWIAGGGWLAFMVYWEYAKKNSAPVKSAESAASRLVHVFLVNAALLLEILQIRGLGRYEPVLTWMMDLGLTIEAAGLALAIWARVYLGRNWSGQITIKVDHRLIRTGPYKWLRHPIYTGILAMYLGTALVSGERLALVGLAMACLAYGRKLRLEEANLAVAFGDEYEAYRRESWALVPGLY